MLACRGSPRNEVTVDGPLPNGNGHHHGIYVVFWFGAEIWLKTDSRRRRCVRDAQRLQDVLVEQARTLSDNSHAIVRAFVLNGSLPPATGAVASHPALNGPQTHCFVCASTRGGRSR